MGASSIFGGVSSRAVCVRIGLSSRHTYTRTTSASALRDEVVNARADTLPASRDTLRTEDAAGRVSTHTRSFPPKRKMKHFLGKREGLCRHVGCHRGDRLVCGALKVWEGGFDPTTSCRRRATTESPPPSSVPGRLALRRHALPRILNYDKYLIRIDLCAC